MLVSKAASYRELKIAEVQQPEPLVFPIMRAHMCSCDIVMSMCVKQSYYTAG